MDFEWKKVAAVSAATAYIATSTLRPQWSTTAFLKYYTSVYAVIFFSWGLWTVFLYPKVFSPLRGLPEPKGGSWYNGHFARIRALPTGVPMTEWCGRARLPLDRRPSPC